MYVLGIPITGTEISPSAFILDSFLVYSTGIILLTQGPTSTSQKHYWLLG